MIRSDSTLSNSKGRNRTGLHVLMLMLTALVVGCGSNTGTGLQSEEQHGPFVGGTAKDLGPPITVSFQAPPMRACQSREETLQAILAELSSNILSWCNDQYPGNCAAQGACFDRAVTRSRPETLIVSIRAEARLNETGNQSPSNWSSSHRDDHRLTLEFRWMLGSASQAGDSVTCTPPLRTSFGAGFVRKLTDALRTFGSEAGPAGSSDCRSGSATFD